MVCVFEFDASRTTSVLFVDATVLADLIAAALNAGRYIEAP